MKVKQRMCSLNEALLSEGADLDPVDVIPAASPAHVHAEAERKAFRAQAEEVTEDQRKAVDQFDKENQQDKKVPKNPAFKKMHLDESLLDDANEPVVEEAFEYDDPMDMGVSHTAPMVPDYNQIIDEANKEMDAFPDDAPLCRKRLARVLNTLLDAKEQVERFNNYWTERYPALIDFVDGQLAKMPSDLRSTDVTEDVDPDFFEDDDVPLEEAAVEAPAEEKKAKGFGFGEREKKERRDYSSEDLWLAVYDELSATTDNEGDGQQVNKQIKAKRGQRYEKVYPHGDSDIIVYAPSIEKLDFAKQVAEHYGVTYDEPKEDKNKSTNGFYRYSMVIHIPEDGLYSED